MKKLLCFLLSFVIAFSCITIAFAQTEENEMYPIIIVPGYSGSALVKNNDDGTSEDVWGIGFDDILSAVLNNIAQLCVGITSLSFGNAQYISDTVGKELLKLAGDLKCNPDGSSVNNITPKFTSAEQSSHQALFDKFGDASYRFEPDISLDMMNYLPMNMIFNFYNDFRKGAVEIAGDLDNYIQQVKSITKKDKVNIFAISHGGQVTGTYLSLYGYKKDVNNVLLNVPALKGAGTVYDLLGDNPSLDEDNLFRFVENGLMLESDYHRLVSCNELGFIDNVIKGLIPYLFEVTKYWGSIWDFCPTECYEKYKSQILTDPKCKSLIEKSDYMHYTIMPNYCNAFTKCREEYNINLNIICGTDNSTTTGGNTINSDGLIYVASSSGATVAPLGTRFSDGYTQINSLNGKYKLSPDMSIDASTCYLPDNTWFIDGLFHGMMVWDNFTKNLMMELLFKNNIKDVYSSEEYPQFHYSTNAAYAVFAKFNKSVEGFIDNTDNKIILNNLSNNNNTIIISSIHSDTLPIQFELKGNKIIKAGQSVEIPFTADLTNFEGKVIDITISFLNLGSLTPFDSRTEFFTVSGNSNTEYNSDAKYSSLKILSPCEKTFSTNIVNMLKKIKLYDIINFILYKFN